MSSAAVAFPTLGLPKQQRIIKCAIAGFGAFGERTLFRIEQLSNNNSANAQLRLVAVCDIFAFRLSYFQRICKNTEQLKRSRIFDLGCQTYEDFDQMLANEKIDVLFVCTPDCFHEKQVMASLQSGIHAWCALPLADSVKAAQNILRSAKHSGMVLGCAPYLSGSFLHAQKLIERYCLLGKIVHLRTTSDVEVKTCGLRDSKDEIARYNSHASVGGCPIAPLKKYGFNTRHEVMRWRQYRKFGLNEMLTKCYYSSGEFLRLLPSLPEQVNLFDYNGPETFSSPITVRFDCRTARRKVAAEILMFGTSCGTPLHINNIYGEFGRMYIGGVSFFELKDYGVGGGNLPWEQYGGYRCAPIWDKVFADNALGERLDMSGVNIMDERSILTFERDDMPAQEKQAELDKLDRYKGGSDKWEFPKKLKNVWFAGRHFDAFIKRVAEHRIDMTEIHQAYIAQIMVDGIERAQKSGCHKFDPRLETFTQHC